MDRTKYRYRLLARITVEATTPLAVGSGEKGIVADSFVATDVNGLPYIPATSIAGVLRHAIGEEIANTFFGNSGKENKNEMTGSEIIFTEAKLVDKEGRPVDGLAEIDKNDEFLNAYLNLPIRQHNSINKCGSVKDTGLFNEQIVYKGSRFCFEMEMLSEKAQNDKFERVLDKIGSSSFRIGSGVTCGFGEMRVVSCKTRSLDMHNQDDMNFYANKSADLSVDWTGDETNVVSGSEEDVTVYTLRLRPADFFLFGSGFGDDEADMTPVKERIVEWKNGKGQLSEQRVLIPATSVKGAIAHRTAYHYNKMNGYFVDDEKAKTGDENTAVRELFGYAGDKDKSMRGNVSISDVHISEGMSDKVVPHVAIDRFTGGTLDGALFSEKAVYGNRREITLTVRVAKKNYQEKVTDALELSIADICKGLLPLGGGVNRGNGAFNGTLTKDGETIYGK